MALECFYLIYRYFNAYLNAYLFRIVSFIIKFGNKASCSPIRSVIMLAINKSDSLCAVVRFCYRSCNNRPNWTPLSSITITDFYLFFFPSACFYLPKPFFQLLQKLKIVRSDLLRAIITEMAPTSECTGKEYLSLIIAL